MEPETMTFFWNSYHTGVVENGLNVDIEATIP